MKSSEKKSRVADLEQEKVSDVSAPVEKKVEVGVCM